MPFFSELLFFARIRKKKQKFLGREVPKSTYLPLPLSLLDVAGKSILCAAVGIDHHIDGIVIIVDGGIFAHFHFASEVLIQCTHVISPDTFILDAILPPPAFVPRVAFKSMDSR